MASKFEIRVLGRFEAHVEGNENHVTFTLLAGPDWDHLSYCGTVTMTEVQLQDLTAGLRRRLADDVRLVDDRPPVGAG